MPLLRPFAMIEYQDSLILLLKAKIIQMRQFQFKYINDTSYKSIKRHIILVNCHDAYLGIADVDRVKSKLKRTTLSMQLLHVNNATSPRHELLI